MRRAFAVLAVLASVWGAVVWLLDGVTLSVGPLRLSSSDSIRPLVTAAAAAIVYFALSSQTATREDARRLRRALTPQRVALLLTSVVITVGVANNSWARLAVPTRTRTHRRWIVVARRLEGTCHDGE